jgi:hypothetical protein
MSPLRMLSTTQNRMSTNYMRLRSTDYGNASLATVK